MKVFSLLYILHLCRICTCVDNGQKPREVEGINPTPIPTTGNGVTTNELQSLELPLTLDLSKPDESSVVVVRESVDSTKALTCVSKKDMSRRSVVYGGVEIWKAKPEERCLLANLISDDTSEFLSMWISDGTYTYKYFEKVGREWKELAKEEYENKSKKIVEVLKVHREASSHKAKHEASDVKSAVSKGMESSSPELSPLDNKDSLTSQSVPPVVHLGETVESSVNTAASQGSELPTKPVTPSPQILDLSNPNSSLVDVVRQEDKGGVTFREYKPKDGLSISSIKEDNEEIWKGKDGENFLSVNLLSDAESTFIGVGIDGDTVPKFEYFEKVGKRWNKLDYGEYEKRTARLRESLKYSVKVKSTSIRDSMDLFKDSPDLVESTTEYEESQWSPEGPTESSQDESTYSIDSVTHSEHAQGVPSVDILDSADFLGVSTSANLQGTQLGEQDSPLLSDGEPETLHLKGSQSQLKKPKVLLAGKIDPSMFTAKDGDDEGVPTLKLTVKTGVTAKKLTFDKKEVWSSDTFSGSTTTCSSATLYFDGDTPKLAIVTTKDNKGNEYQVYKWYFADKWQDNTRDGHNAKLAELKKQYKNARD